MNRVAAMALCAAAALMPAVACAQSTEAWKFGLSIYGWFPSIDGSTTFPAPPGGSDITVDASDILSNLQSVLMGSFEARKGRWGGFTDLVYMDLGKTQSQTRNFILGGQQVPVDVSATLKYDLKGTVWTLAGAYRAVDEPGLFLDAFAGTRMADIAQKLDYSLGGNLGPIAPPDRTGSRKVDLTHWDAIVGLKGRLSFGPDRKWFTPYYADIGAGESDLTYQLMTGIGYSFGWGDLVAQWRYLDYDLGEKIDKLSFNGPAVAVHFRW